MPIIYKISKFKYNSINHANFTKKRGLSMLDKNSQAALEFLMSYGWAIVGVIVAVGALSYFGILNFNALLPEKCVLATGIECLDFKAGADGVSFVVKNSIGDSVVIETIALSGYGDCEAAFFTKLDNGKQGIFDVGCDLNSAGQKLNSEIRLVYESTTTLRHNSSGRIITRIEKAAIGIGSGLSNLQICQNAQNSGLCSGLEFYGEGYQAACCSEHGLCC